MENLPPFTIRESPKAKKVILKVSFRHGLEVVIPWGFYRKQVLPIIQEKREWLERAWKKIQLQGFSLESPRDLPVDFYCPAVCQEFTVEYVLSDEPSLRLEQHLFHLKISGDISHQRGCRHLLQRWLQQQGRVHFIPWLKRLSFETGLSFAKVQIRGQKSRWGSCSNLRTISLNYNLLFLRPEVVRYLMLHELCHTVYLDHSVRFYQLLEKCEPGYRELRGELRQAWNRLPWWAV